METIRSGIVMSRNCYVAELLCTRRGRGLSHVGDDPLVRGRPIDEGRAEEEPAVSGGDGRVSTDVARLRRDAEGEELHHMRASFITTATWSGERPQPSRWGSVSGMRCRGSR